MNEWWAARELAGVAGMPGTVQSVNRKAQAEQWQFREVDAKGGPGGKRREYHLSSLPEETRMALLMGGAGSERKGSRLDFGRKGSGLDFAANGRDKDQGTDPDTQDSDPGQLEAWLEDQRISLSPAELADPRMQAKIACARAYAACPAYQGREKLLAALAARHEVSPVTIRRWVDDVEGLRRRTRHRITLGDERVELPASSAFSPEALACGLSSYANNIRGGIATAYRVMIERAAQRQGSGQKDRGQASINGGVRPCTLTDSCQSQSLTPVSPAKSKPDPDRDDPDREWRIGDYGTFARIVKKIPASVWLRISKGATGFELHGVPKIIKEWTAIPVQSVTCGDQKIIDRYVYDPALDRIIVPNAYLWMDCASRAITGCWIELGHYNSYTVGNSLREQARYGINDEIYTDWGAPEGGKHLQHILRMLSGYSRTGDFSAMEERYGDMAGDIRHRKAQAGKPWVKPIENIMNIIEKRLDEKDMRGYRKRLADPWENKEAQALLKKQAKAGMLPTIEEFIETFFSVVREHNLAEKQLAEGRTIVPWEFFARGLYARPPVKFDDRTLDYIFLPSFERIPRQATVGINMRGEMRRYASHKLSGWKGGKVWVSVDPYDRDAPAVITSQGGAYIDLAEPWHAQNPYDQPGIAAKRQRQAELMRYVAEQAKRVKAGFDLWHAPEAQPREVIKVTSATATAREAEKEITTYRLQKENVRLVTKDHDRQAATGLDDLMAEMECADERFIIPKDGKDKYRLWLALDAAVDNGEALIEEQEEFWRSYRRDAEWKAHRDLHEQWGTVYIEETETGSGLRAVN